MKYLVQIMSFMVLTFAIMLSGHCQEQDSVNDKHKDIHKDLNEFSEILKSSINYSDEDYFDGKTSILIKNTNIRISPPKAFRLDEKQSNLLIQDWTGSNILVQEINAPYKKMLSGINEETFIKQGFEYISSYDVFTKSGNEGKLFILSFKTGEWEYERMVLLSGNNQKTAWISANYPVIMRHLLYEIMENSILNIEF
ncbi:MAG: hypothetical protein PHI36_07275 [Bacteroidales bacterium]|nr:hypothetical protein [Bacteroidales bacterium]MDD4576212.1 hypothetical protein [Bacteroidales bacterium]